MNTNFPEWLLNQLSARGWSQNELARRSTVSQSMISKVMNYQSEPGLDFLQGISEALNIPLEAVMRESGVLPKTRGEFIDEVTDLLKHLPIEERAYVYQLAKLHYRHVKREGATLSITNEDPIEP